MEARASIVPPMAGFTTYDPALGWLRLGRVQGGRQWYRRVMPGHDGRYNPLDNHDLTQIDLAERELSNIIERSRAGA